MSWGFARAQGMDAYGQGLLVCGPAGEGPPVLAFGDFLVHEYLQGSWPRLASGHG